MLISTFFLLQYTELFQSELAKNLFLAFDFSVLNLVVSRSLTRSLFSVSFFARWTTWRRLKLFKNRTGTAQQDTSNSTDQPQQQHYWTSFKSSSLVATVTMPWTHSTTTSGTSPSWSTSLVSFVIESWGPIQTFRYSVSPPFTKPCKEHFRCLFVHLLRPLCLKCLYVLFLDCAQIFTTNEERLRRDK